MDLRGGEPGRAHRWRAESDAVAVGIGTALPTICCSRRAVHDVV